MLFSFQYSTKITTREYLFTVNEHTTRYNNGQEENEEEDGKGQPHFHTTRPYRFVSSLSVVIT